MRISGRTLATLGALLVMSACATTTREPVADIPTGTYVLVEPASDVYHAVAIAPGAYSVRMGNETHSGQFWRHSDGRTVIVDDTGPCAGQESVWSYTVSGNRLTLERVSDACTARDADMPARLVYERR